MNLQSRQPALSAAWILTVMAQLKAQHFFNSVMANNLHFVSVAAALEDIWWSNLRSCNCRCSKHPFGFYFMPHNKLSFALGMQCLSLDEQGGHWGYNKMRWGHNSKQSNMSIKKQTTFASVFNAHQSEVWQPEAKEVSGTMTGKHLSDVFRMSVNYDLISRI